MRTIGLMAGTSLDGVDAAVADLDVRDGALVLRPLGGLTHPYSPELGTALRAALPPALVDLGTVCELDTRIGQEFAAAAVTANTRIADGRATLVSSHGQTVFHWVQDGETRGTLQLGQPAWIAERTGLPVVADLRSRDVAANGQGAPLVGLVDAMLLRGLPGRVALVNIGGIANVTVLDGNGDAVAFDTGPGNALLDAAAHHFSSGALDRDENGVWARSGTVLPQLLERLLAEPYYRRAAPKTTGKELFHGDYLRRALAGQRPEPADVLATLTELTARTIAAALRPYGVTELRVSGGGTHNRSLMAALRTRTGLEVRDTAELGFDPDLKEAYAFAVLGFLSVQGWAATEPSTTGAVGPRVLGAVTPGHTGTRPPRQLHIDRYV
ncbi:anhydro-N-acetylmuramic acid kinase [Lipingzhangella sp. LS1_29]|uniref:Anhydro-N-acetylmuramic acid kinase n=1 Tax=Lipingzhangella rawalii TaxID=2055835 RepID=A0ABU2H9K5_9ACTN|nr:anhydro-N-acetylmuramic acid kinase [Lipingzhangella rawalii]MDS1271987.1 anhydro-N-acetylmuramic acid kinase [Lipingzhangella rawalii]